MTDAPRSRRPSLLTRESWAKRLAAGGKLDEKEANKTVKSSDKERRDYFKRFYDVREELPTHYDVVINTDVLSQEQAVNVILAAAAGTSDASERRFGRPN